MAIFNHLKTVLVLGALTGLLLGIGYYFGGPTGLTIALIISIAINFGSYYFSDKLVLRMYRAKEASKADYPELHRIVHDVAHLANLPVPKIYVVPTATPNAFATGRNPQHAVVACTEGIMSLLSRDELKGVIAHEMGHIKNRDILIQTVAATIAGVISYLAMMARFAAIFGGGRDQDSGDMFYLLGLAILTPLIAMLLQMALSRSREYLADETGAKTIHNPYALANALEKLDSGVKRNPMRFGSPATSSMFILNPFSARGLTKLFSTHPPMQERIKRLKAMKA